VWLRALGDFSFVLACLANTFFVLAVAIRFGQFRAPVTDSLKFNAYGMYLIHYAFVVWLQFALLGVDLPAIVKGGVVFLGTLALSWSLTAALRRQRFIAQLIGAERKHAQIGVARGNPAPWKGALTPGARPAPR
jgi:hypothetical protein